MVFAEVSLLTTNLRSAIEIARGLKSSYDAHTIVQAQSDLLARLIDIQTETIALQEKHSTLIHEKEELKNKLVQFEQWEITKSKYVLKEIIRGIFVYSLKDSQQSEEPLHWLCPNCWKKREESILQAEFDNGEEAKYFCPECEFSFRFYHKQLL